MRLQQPRWLWNDSPQLSSSLWSSQSRCPSQCLLASTQRPDLHLKWLGEHSITTKTHIKRKILVSRAESFSDRLQDKRSVPSTPASGSRQVVFPPSSGNWLQSESSGHCNPTMLSTDSHFSFALRHSDLQGERVRTAWERERGKVSETFQRNKVMIN